MKIIFMGTPTFAEKALAKLAGSEHEIMCCCCQPDRASGRGNKVKAPEVKQKALTLGIPVLQPERIKDEAFMAELEGYAPDIIVVAAYGKILPSDILALPKYGCINIHASLLPKYRGAAPIQHAILNGDEVTGVTIMQMAEGMDTGDMLAQAKTPVASKNSEELHDELSELGADLLMETLRGIEKGEVHPVPQDEALATIAPMISKKDGLIDWRKTAKEIECKTRAFYPWPGAYTMMDGEMFKIWQAEVIDGPEESSPGQIVNAGPGGIDIGTGLGILRALTVQLPGKKHMPAAEFLKGREIEKGTVLG